jgi:transposase
VSTRGEKKRRARAVPDTVQQAFGFETPASEEDRGRAEHRLQAVQFEEGQRRQYVGAMALEQYLEQGGLKAVRVLGQFMSELDVSAFEAAYKPGGRPPLHPRLVLSLIVYGIHLRQWSLRELEQLAVRDVGAWFLCSGVQPDHSTRGKFIVRHQKLLSDEFFVSTTRALAQKLGLKEGEAAADGTVIQAAASLRSLAQKQVLEAQAQQARQAVEAAAQAGAARRAQARLERQAQRLEQAVALSTQRAQERAAHRRPPPHLSRQEPEAVNQPCKDGLFRLAYKPSVLVHASGLIVAQALHPTSEVGVLEGLLKQTQAVGVEVASLALDAGYFQIQVLRLALERGLDVLCPPDRLTRNPEGLAITAKGLFAKAAFPYDEQQDVYLCPAGQALRPGQWTVEADTQMRVRHYGTRACKGCPLRAQCTSSARSPRKIRRHEGQELKDAMVQVFEHPAARKRYARRSHIVEPVFAELKERQGLKRFHRRGVLGAQLEFSLHCLALNLKRGVLAVCVLALRWLSTGESLLFLRVCVLRLSPSPPCTPELGIRVPHPGPNPFR